MFSGNPFEGKETIHMKGYSSYVFNRRTHIRAVKGSGGVAILIRDSVLQDFDVDVLDKCVDGILGVQLTNKDTDFK